jgi:hypothetical protein
MMKNYRVLGTWNGGTGSVYVSATNSVAAWEIAKEHGFIYLLSVKLTNVAGGYTA